MDRFSFDLSGANNNNLAYQEIIEALEAELTDFATEFPVGERNSFADGFIHGIISCITTIKCNMED